MRIGLIARAEATGLSVLTHEFWRHMKPAKTLIVDMTKRGGGPSTINRDLYAGDPNVSVIDNVNYPQRLVVINPVIDDWLTDLDVVFTAETPYDYCLFSTARERGIKTVLQPMFEFFEYFVDDTLPQPDLFAFPSSWRLDEVPYANKIVLPVPVARDRLPFQRRTAANVFFHNCGNQTMRDRNGTLLFLEAMRRVPQRYSVKAVVHSNKRLQNPAPRRIMVDQKTKPFYWQNYSPRFDVAVMPRKYAGLCLPLNEASSCGIPTIMSDTSPQNTLLPAAALMPCSKGGELITRTLVDVMEVPIDAITAKIVELHTNPELVAELSDAADAYAESISWTNMQPVYEIHLKLFAHLGPDLRADDRTEKQIQGQDEIHTLIHPCLHDGDVDGSKKYLEQAGAYDHMHRHAEDIDHYGDHNEAPADTHDGGEDAHQSSRGEEKKNG